MFYSGMEINFSWNLNMFTLIGIGTGVAFLFSLVGMFFPRHFPAEFKTERNSFLLFEATAVILTLVLLGQLLGEPTARQVEQ
jgi:Cu2+-exporting ATPase